MDNDKGEELFKQLRLIDMANAKQELLGALEKISAVIKCATINSGSSWYNDEYVTKPPILLREGYTPAEYEEFLGRLDFEYDSGYGGQELFGTIWLTKENTWLERGEYDGSEWWAYRVCPPVPDNLKAD